MPTWSTLSLALLVAATAGCRASTPTTPSPTAVALRGEVNDPAGDSPSDPRVAASSDLVHATADVIDGQVTFVVRFSPTTLDRQNTRVVILLDTDQTASTGIRQSGGTGADYALQLFAGQASIARANPATCAGRQNCFDGVGTAPIAAIPDGMQVTVPLATLGNTDGRMTFTMHSYVTIVEGASRTPISFDFMPDVTLPPGRVQ